MSKNRTLEISPQTAQSHVERIFSELAVSTRTEAVLRAVSKLSQRGESKGDAKRWRDKRTSGRASADRCVSAHNHDAPPPTCAAIEPPTLVELVTRMQMKRLRSLVAALSRGVAMRSSKTSISASNSSRVHRRLTPSLHKDTAWRLVTTPMKFENRTTSNHRAITPGRAQFHGEMCPSTAVYKTCCTTNDVSPCQNIHALEIGGVF
jgi:hypothetical protein